MSADSLTEKYRGAGSPGGQASSQSQSGIPVLRVGVANHPRHRSHPHDPQRPSEVLSERGRPRTSLVLCGSLPSVDGCVMKRDQGHSCARLQTLQHFHNAHIRKFIQGETTRFGDVVPLRQNNFQGVSTARSSRYCIAHEIIEGFCGYSSRRLCLVASLVAGRPKARWT